MKEIHTSGVHKSAYFVLNAQRNPSGVIPDWIFLLCVTYTTSS